MQVRTVSLCDLTSSVLSMLRVCLPWDEVDCQLKLDAIGFKAFVQICFDHPDGNADGDPEVVFASSFYEANMNE